MKKIGLLPIGSGDGRMQSMEKVEIKQIGYYLKDLEEGLYDLTPEEIATIEGGR